MRKLCYDDAVLLSLIPKWLIRLLFRSFEARDDFVLQVKNLRRAFPDRPLAFALFGGGIVEYLAIHLFLREEFGEKFELRIATRLPSLAVESLSTNLRRIASFFRLGPKARSRIRLVADELKAGRPAILNFSTLERKSAFQTPLGELELSYLNEKVPDLIIAPVVLIWRRARRLEESENQNLSALLWRNFKAPFRSPWQFLLGDPYQPTDLRKILLMLRQYGRSTMRLALPFEASAHNPKHLRRKILTTIQQEKRIILGNNYRSTRLIEESILRSPSFQTFVRNLAAEEGQSELALYRKASKIFNEMAARFKYFTIESAAWFLHQVFTKIFEDVTVREEDFEKIRECSREAAIVYIPSHKSYVDFLLLSYLLFRKDILPPHVAAGINLNVWPVGNIFKGGGAFFIRRSFRGNHLYTEILKRYIEELLSNRISLEFFIEGARSRSGKLSPPKFGMLKMIAESALAGRIQEKIKLVPVSITYDRVTEERAHKLELEGGKKVQESTLGVVKSSKVLFKTFGKVHVRVGEPLDLQKNLDLLLGENKSDEDKKRLAVQKLAFEVCHRINEVTPVTSFGLICGTLLARPGAAMSRAHLDAFLAHLEVELRKSRVMMTPELDLSFAWACQRAISKLLSDKLLEAYQAPDGSQGLKISRKQRVAALYYKNSAIHALLPWAVRGLAGEDKERLLTLRSYLKFEFFFSDTAVFLENISALPDGDHYKLVGFMLDDVLESITVGLSGLKQMQGLWLEEKEWTQRLMKFGQSGLEEATVTRPEAVNTRSFSAFLELAKNKKWLKSSPNKQASLLTPVAVDSLNIALNEVRSYRPRPEDWNELILSILNKNEPETKATALHPAPSERPET